MRNFIIIHGSYDSSKEHWFPWMKNEIERLGYECIVPDFPCENGHQLNEWIETFDTYKDKVTAETVFIAHSRGVSFVLNLLTKFEYQIDTLYMIGGFIDYLWIPKAIPDTFFVTPFDIQKIKRQCSKFVSFHSDNDEYIPVEHFEKVINTFDARPLFVKGAGHFTAKLGYTQFPELLADIKKDIL